MRKRRYISAMVLTIWCWFSLNYTCVHAADKGSSPDPLPQGVKTADSGPAEGGIVMGETQERKEENKQKPSLPLKGPETSPRSDAYKGRLFLSKGKKAVLPHEKGIAELRAFVDKSSVTIGEKITYTLEIDAENNLEIEFPSYASGLGGFAVKDFGTDKKKIGRSRVRRRQWYLLDTYTTGSYVIPVQTVKVKTPFGKTKTLKSPEIFIEVKSVLEEGREKDGLRDIKEPLSVNPGMPVGIVIIFIAALLAAGGIILRRLYLKKISEKKTSPPPKPHEIAYKELKRIEGMDLIEKRRFKELYYMVSLCLRSYLESRFSLNAPEQTTEEFLKSITNSSKLEGRYINLLKEYLNHCDLVKYARFNPGKSQSQKLIETTRRFIEETTKTEQDGGEKNADGAEE